MTGDGEDPITGNDEADKLLEEDPLALLLGMLLDQQVPMEWAFFGPTCFEGTDGRRLDARTIITTDPEAFLAIAKGPRAIHRFPGSMGKRVQAVCQAIVAEYDGEASRIWTEAKGQAPISLTAARPASSAPDKTSIFIALLAETNSIIRPEGGNPRAGRVRRRHAQVGRYRLPGGGARVREWKQAMKKQGKTKRN